MGDDSRGQLLPIRDRPSVITTVADHPMKGRILSLNGDNHETICERLNVPTTHEAVAVLLLGYSAEDTTDATSSASVRNDMADKVSIIK